ncbi:Hypothetical_protein [Hexamita inflata]|uniref:Hypothetical_protein n=1 Tax=Hexamita inflata TaxID=28002 RepID=A0AA86UJR3_9EUKA|nr:Hypothetical protein HINF_LOCUS41462 [Hexamita inflata]
MDRNATLKLSFKPAGFQQQTLCIWSKKLPQIYPERWKPPISSESHFVRLNRRFKSLSGWTLRIQPQKADENSICTQQMAKRHLRGLRVFSHIHCRVITHENESAPCTTRRTPFLGGVFLEWMCGRLLFQGPVTQQLGAI